MMEEARRVIWETKVDATVVDGAATEVEGVEVEAEAAAAAMSEADGCVTEL